MKEQWKKEEKNILQHECMEYFRERPVFERLLKGFLEKYRSYGSFSGTIRLQNLTQKDVEELEGFFQKNFHGKKSASISALQFEKALKESRFESITPDELLKLYFGKKVVGKKEEKQQEEQRWHQLYKKYGQISKGTPAEEWIHSLQNKKNTFHIYLQKNDRESDGNLNEAERLLKLGIKILNELPYRQGQLEYLAVFASMITGNPHAFDEGSKEGQLLFMLIQWDLEQRGFEIEKQVLFPSIHKQRAYLTVGILRDDVSNYGMISGVRAWRKNGELHEGMEGFLKEGDMVQVSLAVIADWKHVECPGKEIFVVENPSVYAILCGKWKGRRACMCMNGQPRLSSLLLLDLLAEAGVKVYYAGDFDPEGLLIAQKLKQYYKGEFEYWHMTEEVYIESRSNEVISERRIKMLERIQDEELKEVVRAIKEYKASGYQENVWRVYL